METTKPKNTKVQTFRDTATDGEWNKLIETALSTTPIGTRVQDDFGFSWSAMPVINVFVFGSYISCQIGPCSKSNLIFNSLVILLASLYTAA